MSAVEKVLKVGIEHIPVDELIGLMCKDHETIEWLKCECDRWSRKAMSGTPVSAIIGLREKPQNKPYTLDDVYALPYGTEGWVEYGPRESCRDNGIGKTKLYNGNVERPCIIIGGNKWFLWGEYAPHYNSWFRFWPRKPTESELAANPWPQQNHVLTRDELNQWPEGEKKWVENSGRAENDGWYVRYGIRVVNRYTGDFWAPFKSSDQYISNLYRVWSNGKPTEAESAAVPWGEA